jgi:hypothetical protein
MIELSDIVIALWFLPVTAFILLLIVAFFGILYSLFYLFKPGAGHKGKPMKMN